MRKTLLLRYITYIVRTSSILTIRDKEKPCGSSGLRKPLGSFQEKAGSETSEKALLPAVFVYGDIIRPQGFVVKRLGNFPQMSTRDKSR